MAKKASSKQNRRDTRMTNVATATSGTRERKGLARAHGELVDNLVHVFVDDQNLFYGATNHYEGHGFRVDFGRLLTVASSDGKGAARGAKSAYMAGVIPDDDSFWAIAEKEGFTVRRGYLGHGNRSKQDDAHLITAIMETIYEQKGPSTIVLVAGDADYGPPLAKAIEKGWRVEICFHRVGLSGALEPVAHEIRTLNPGDYGLLRDGKGLKIR